MSEQKGVMQWTRDSFQKCRLFSTSVRVCDVVCPLDTAPVTELWRLHLFSCTSSSFLCAGTLSPRGKCCYFCGRFSWSRQTSLVKGFSYYFHNSTTDLYFRSTTRQCRCYSKTKTTMYCLKHEGKSHRCHPSRN